MTNLLIRLFVRDAENSTNPAVRCTYGRLASAVGIASNLLLCVLKLLVGMISGSIAIMADAVNNLSDSASSVITLAAFKLSAMPADEQHPYGHARFEYISGLVVSFLIMVIGLQFLLSSVRKIFAPEPVEFGTPLVIILLASIGIKLWQGLFNRRIGTLIASEALRATAADSRNDVVATSVVLAGAVAGHLTGLQLDGWMGVAVALFILFSGARLVFDTLNPLLGMAPDAALVEKLERRILDCETVLGIHDLILHTYGPGRCFASAHAEVPAEQDILISHDLIDNIERQVALEMGIELVIHLDPIITDNGRLNGYRQEMERELARVDPILSMHDFRVVEGKTHVNFIFDVAVPPRFRLTDDALRTTIGQRVSERFGQEYYCIISLDRSYTTSRTKMDRKGNQ